MGAQVDYELDFRKDMQNLRTPNSGQISSTQSPMWS